jgi:arginase family enzyme
MTDTTIGARDGFLRTPHAELGELRAGQVAFGGVPHDATHNTRFGTRFGPRSVREASWELYDELAGGPVLDGHSGRERRLAGDGAAVDVGDLAVHPTDVHELTRGVSADVAAIVRAGARPALIGGDHYVTYPNFLGFAEAAQERGARRLGYIQLDGHLDFSSDNAVWGRLYHGSNARRISEHALVDPRNIAWVGTQGYQQARNWQAIADAGATSITHDVVHEIGMVEAVRRAAEIASDGTDAVYVTVDIDVMDAGFAPGTGGVVIGGIEPEELIAAADELSSIEPAAVDVVEVAPNLDVSGRTSRFAAEALLRLVGSKLLPAA